ncbi:MAG: zinc-ribbon domain-containing protein [Anaerovibrio sp.]|nr:zinc-ribbon domain-containing protein [Anaerovibrio sp.]
MKFCTKCGKQIDDDAVFCNFCGAQVLDERAMPQMIQQKICHLLNRK